MRLLTERDQRNGFRGAWGVYDVVIAQAIAELHAVMLRTGLQLEMPAVVIAQGIAESRAVMLWTGLQLEMPAVGDMMPVISNTVIEDDAIADALAEAFDAPATDIDALMDWEPDTDIDALMDWEPDNDLDALLLTIVREEADSRRTLDLGYRQSYRSGRAMSPGPSGSISGAAPQGQNPYVNYVETLEVEAYNEP